MIDAMNSRRSEFLAGIRAELPILLGVLPFGMVYGASALNSNVSASLSQAMSGIVFAGSAQFVIVQLIGAATPYLSMVLIASLINLRHMLYSASVAPYLRHLHPLWKWLLAYLLTDEAYAVAIIHYQRPGDNTYKHWYFLGAGLALWSTWQSSSALGLLLGEYVPASWSLDFTIPLTFIALVVPGLKDRPAVAAALIAGIMAVVAAPLPYNLNLIVATLAGLLAGLSLEFKKRPVLEPDGATR